MMPRHVVRLAQNNLLANRRLLTACLDLTPGGFEAPRTGFFPSLRATLNHILTVDWFYVDALEGGTLGPAAWADEEPCRTVAELLDAQSSVDRRLLAFCQGLTPEGLTATVRMHRGTPGLREGPASDRRTVALGAARSKQVEVAEDRCDDVLDHLFQHQTHHRGQAHAMLAGTNVRPPQLDEFLMAGDASRRAPDLAALGWTEADLG